LFIKNIDQLEAEATEAVKNMPELSFRTHSGKSDSGDRAWDPCMSVPAPAPPSEVTAELVSLVEFCSSLAKHLSLSDLLVNLECRLRRLLPFSTCAFFFDNGNDTLEVVHSGGKYADKLQNIRIGLGSGISGWVAAYGHPMINSESAPDFQSSPCDVSSPTHSLVVPMNMDGTCLGSISLYAEAPVSYTDDNLRILQMVANQAVPVLAEARRRTALPSDQDLIDSVTGAHRARYLEWKSSDHQC
jgi:putative methionine-R-sulfoxide reductase with GAF domain